MRPKERRDSGQKDLFRARLDQIVDMGHPLARLAGSVDWAFLEERFGAVYSDKAGHPPLSTRLMAGLSILKHMHDLSDEELCERWVENPLYQGSVVKDLLLSVAGGFGFAKTGTPQAARSSLNLISGRPRRPAPKSLIQGRRSSTATGPIYFGGRPKPRHGFSRSLPILVMEDHHPSAFMLSARPRQAQDRFRDIAIRRRLACGPPQR